MSDTFDMLRALLERVDLSSSYAWTPVRHPHERVVRPLTPSEVREHQTICEHDNELKAHLRRALRLARLMDAKRTLFADHLQYSSAPASELLETAELRGKLLALRQDSEGVPVVVELDPEFA